MDAEEEEEEEMEEEEEEGEEDAIERLKTEIGDRYDEETGKVATVQVSDQLVLVLQILSQVCKYWEHMNWSARGKLICSS